MDSGVEMSEKGTIGQIPVTACVMGHHVGLPGNEVVLRDMAKALLMKGVKPKEVSACCTHRG